MQSVYRVVARINNIVYATMTTTAQQISSTQVSLSAKERVQTRKHTQTHTYLHSHIFATLHLNIEINFDEISVGLQYEN